jgi:nucleoside diphosphate kinase
MTQLETTGGPRPLAARRTPARVPAPATPPGLVGLPVPAPRPTARSVGAQVAGLTRSPGKAGHYAGEPYLRESWADLTAVLGDATQDVVMRHGLVLIKPDGLALERTRPALEFFRANGFRVVAARVTDVTALQWRAMWTFQLTQATLDRILLNDLIMRGPGLLLVLRADRPDELPAAVRLSLLKGPAVPEQQSDGCLRRAVAQPNRIFSLVHSADEPLDLVRELGLLLDGPERRRFAAAMGAADLPPDPSQLEQEVAGLPTVARRFDPGTSRRRIAAAVRRAGPVPQAAALRAGVAALEGTEPLDFTGLLAAVQDAGLALDPWDLAVAASEVVVADDEDGAKVIDNLGPEVWRS